MRLLLWTNRRLAQRPAGQHGRPTKHKKEERDSPRPLSDDQRTPCSERLRVFQNHELARRWPSRATCRARPRRHRRREQQNTEYRWSPAHARGRGRTGGWQAFLPSTHTSPCYHRRPKSTDFTSRGGQRGTGAGVGTGAPPTPPTDGVHASARSAVLISSVKIDSSLNLLLLPLLMVTHVVRVWLYVKLTAYPLSHGPKGSIGRVGHGEAGPLDFTRARQAAKVTSS
jgi:hypothetical protein